MTFEGNNGDEWAETEEEAKALDLEMLREDLVAELQAINQYQQHFEMLDDEEAQEVVRRLISEEKEHVAELVKLVLKLDPDQVEKFERLGL
ncbi:MAG: hypothetical protein AB1603_06450 [Chloroflexota bacterium]